MTAVILDNALLLFGLLLVILDCSGERVGDSTNGDFGSEVDALPLNVRTKVTLECKGNDVKLTVGENVYTATQPTYRFAGNLVVYAGDRSLVPGCKSCNIKYTLQDFTCSKS